MTQLGLAPGSIERVRVDVVVVPLFAGESPLRDAAARVDWRLCGRLSRLFASGRLTARPGEAVLMPGGGGLRSPRLLGLGIGEREGLDAERWRDWVADALSRSALLRARHAALALPESKDRIRERMSAVVACAESVVGLGAIALAPEPADGPALAEWLRSESKLHHDSGLEIHLPRQTRLPQGNEASAARAVSSHPSAGRFTR